jgi:hypothetical protein
MILSNNLLRDFKFWSFFPFEDGMVLFPLDIGFALFSHPLHLLSGKHKTDQPTFSI